jgi:DNA-binding NtrC family response regulator
VNPPDKPRISAVSFCTILPVGRGAARWSSGVPNREVPCAEVLSEATEAWRETETVDQSSKISTILIVEDDADHARLMTEILKSSDVEVLHVDTCGLALAVLGDREFDLVILDMNLPDGRGTDVQEALIAAGSPSRIIFVTSEDQVEQAVLALKRGASDYVVKKPLYLDELRGVVARLNEGFVISPKEEFRSREREDLIRVLNSNRWNVSAAARTLDVSRGKLRNQMKSLGIDS